ncbi:integrase catalytic domain-containing protein [Trichonephila clavipes]|nr:integrase catalytic domain-containing protein [Trichonephila clavipes]
MYTFTFRPNLGVTLQICTEVSKNRFFFEPRKRFQLKRLTRRPGLKKDFDFDQSLEREQKPSVEETRRHFSKTSFNLCRGLNSAQIFRLCRGWNYRRKSACVEVGSTHKHLRRGVNSNNLNYITCEEVKSVESKFSSIIGYIVRASNKGARKKKGRIFPYFSKMYKNALKEDLIRVVEDLDGSVESTDTIAILKTKIENSSTFESDPDFVKTLIKNCIDERVSRNEREVTLEKQKIELAKLQLAQLEKEIELQTAKNKALSLNPAAKVEEKQFETNIENMIKSIKTLSLPVPTRSENFNLFFQSLERAFLTKKINDEYKSEILINLLGERAHNVLLYIKEEELNDYEKLKFIVLREFQLTPRECLNSFKNAVKSSGETYIQFAARLTANFQYYCSLRKVNSFESLCDLIISDKLFETLNKETATHIGIREAEDWFRPIDLAKECDIYISSRSGSHKEIPITYGYT